MNRRAFMTKAAWLGGLAALQPWQLLRLLNANTLADAKARLLDWDLTDDAEAAVLMTGYLKNPGTVWGDSSLMALNAGSLTSGDVVATLTDNLDTTYIRPTGQPTSLKFQVQTPGTVSSNWTLDWIINESLVNVEDIGFSVYSDVSNIGSVSLAITLAQESGYTNKYNYFPLTSPPNLYKLGWSTLLMQCKSPDSTNGSPNVNNTFVRLRLLVTCGAGMTGTLYFGPIYKNRKTRCVVTVGFDDGYDTTYTNAYPYMAARGVIGTQNITTGFIGNAGRLSTTQLDALKAAKWSFHNHSVHHTILTSVSVAAAQAEVLEAETWLDDHGYSYGHRTICYPGGSNSVALTAGMTAIGMRYAAPVDNVDQPQMCGINNPMYITRQGIDIAKTLAQVKAKIDSAVVRGSCLHLFTHGVSVGAGANDTELATFQAIIDYLVGLRDMGTISIVSFQEWIDGFTRTRRLRL